METKEEREIREKAYKMAINSMYGTMGGKQSDLQALYEEYIQKQKQEERDKKIQEILGNE